MKSVYIVFIKFSLGRKIKVSKFNLKGMEARPLRCSIGEGVQKNATVRNIYL